MIQAGKMEHGIRFKYFVFGYLPVLGKKGDLVVLFTTQLSQQESFFMLAVIFWNNCFFNKYKGGWGGSTEPKKNRHATAAFFVKPDYSL